MSIILDKEASDERICLEIIRLNPKEEWLGHDLTVTPYGPISKIFYSTLLKHSYKARARQEAIQAQGALRLRAIKENLESSDCGNKVILYNMAIEKFSLMAPRLMVESLTFEPLRKLCEKCICLGSYASPIDRLAFPSRILTTEWQLFLSRMDQDPPTEGLLDMLRSFEERGGRFALVQPLRYRSSNPLVHSIFPSDEIYPICSAGLVRSAITGLVITEIKRKLGLEPGAEKVFAPHGALNGWDVEGGCSPEKEYKECYEKAFGRLRPLRHGTGIARDQAEKHFNETYWHIPNGLTGRRIYIAFADNGIKAVHRLLQANPRADFNKVCVMIIADGDWISNWQLKDLTCNLILTLVDLYQKNTPPEQFEWFALKYLEDIYENEACLGLNCTLLSHLDIKDKFFELIALLSQTDEQERSKEIHQFFQPYAWRFGFQIISEIFQGVSMP